MEGNHTVVLVWHQILGTISRTMSPGETFQNIYDWIGCLPEIPYNFNLCNSPSIAISKETAIRQFGGMLHIEEIEEEVVNISENEN